MYSHTVGFTQRTHTPRVNGTTKDHCASQQRVTSGVRTLKRRSLQRSRRTSTNVSVEGRQAGEPTTTRSRPVSNHRRESATQREGRTGQALPAALAAGAAGLLLHHLALPAAAAADVPPVTQLPAPGIVGDIIHFLTGSFAGAIGASAVYPIDTVKTRMQAQVDPCEQDPDSTECQVSDVLLQELVDDGCQPPQQPQPPGPPLRPLRAAHASTSQSSIPSPASSSSLSSSSAAASTVVLEQEDVRSSSSSTAEGRSSSPAAEAAEDDAVCSYYDGAWDCAQQIVRLEGLGALYKGLGPQVVGVAPEKAIKLTVNDAMRSQLAAALGVAAGGAGLPLWAGVVAGGTAGALQTVVTNPLEAIKIRLQMQTQLGCARQKNALEVAADLGLKGVYKGIGVCILRDATFSAIFFPAYSALQAALPDDLGPVKLLLAGFLAGGPAAYLTTPFDVLKTRLQIPAAAEAGMWSTCVGIYRKEGGDAFMKGGLQRIARSAPQFGVTLFVFETLNTALA